MSFNFLFINRVTDIALSDNLVHWRLARFYAVQDAKILFLLIPRVARSSESSILARDSMFIAIARPFCPPVCSRRGFISEYVV